MAALFDNLGKEERGTTSIQEAIWRAVNSRLMAELRATNVTEYRDRRDGTTWGSLKELAGSVEVFPETRASCLSGAAARKRHILGEYGQAKKGSWWMPRSYCPMKAVVSCEKSRGGAHIPRSANSRMG